jgi:hypothetical protein
MLTKSHLRVVSPKHQNRSVAPKRSANADLRTREYLTPAEIDKLIAAAKTSRYGVVQGWFDDAEVADDSSWVSLTPAGEGAGETS